MCRADDEPSYLTPSTGAYYTALSICKQSEPIIDNEADESEEAQSDFNDNSMCSGPPVRRLFNNGPGDPNTNQQPILKSFIKEMLNE